MGFLYFFICFIISLVIFVIWWSSRIFSKIDSDTEELNRMCQKRAEMFADFLETQKQMKPIIDAKFKRDAERLMKLIDKCKEE